MTADADRVFVNGKLFTSNQERPWARAMAIRGERIVAVGTNAHAERWVGRRTTVIDLRGHVVLPGFIDAHAHLADAAGERAWVRLGSRPSLETAVESLRRAAARVSPGSWVFAVDWDESKWPERRYLRREDLDRASRDRRIVAVRVDRHMASLNGAALEAVPDLVAERGYGVDAAGRPTGILAEDALGRLWERVGAPESAIWSGLPAVAKKAQRLGITSIHDIVDLRGWRAYQRAHRSGRLQLRVTAMLRDELLPALTASGVMTGLGDPWLRLGAIKIFADGSLGAHTAALSAPYADRAGERGMLLHSREELREVLDRAHRAGFQTATHAIGDEAIDRVLDAFEEILQETPRRDARHRIEHYELPTDGALDETRALGILASCQPNFVGQWSAPGALYETRLGPERSSRNNPYGRILRMGIRLCFGSDGMPYGPLYGIHAAVNGFHRSQAISVEEAIQAYTIGGAYASFEEGLKGTLEPGRLADFVVIDGDPFREPHRIRRMRVRSTWIGGARVFPSKPKS